MSKKKLKLLLIVCVILSACQSKPVYFQSGWITYTNVNDVNDISFAPDGYLWAATIGGVVRWDTANKAYIKYSTENGLPSNNISTILADSKGIVWVGTQQGEIASFNDEKWTVYQIPALEIGMTINDIYEDSDGQIWFATYGAGAIMYNGKDWKAYLQNDGLVSVAAQSIGEFPKGNIWVGTWMPQCDCLSRKNVQKRIEPGWSVFDGKGWNTIYEEAGLENNVFGGVASSFAADKQGVWISITDGDGLLFFDGNIFAKQDIPATIRFIFDLKIDQVGNLWGASDTGIFMYDGISWQTYNAGDSLLNDATSSIAVASDGSLWFGTEQGISYFDDNDWGSLIATDPKDSIPITWSISDVAFTPNGGIWLATNSGALYFDGKDWKKFTTKDGLPDNVVRDIDIASDGTIWVRSMHDTTDTISSFDGTKWTVYDYGDFTWFVDFDKDGNFWSWSYDDDQIHYFDGVNWNSLPASEIYFPEKVLVAPDSSLWFQESYDVWRFDGQTWTDLTGNKWITGLAMSPDGSVWIARNDSTNTLGFYKFFDGAWSLQTKFENGAYVTEMVFDRFGVLWTISGRSGESIREIWKYENGKWSQYVLPNGLSASSIYFSPDDSIWFVTDIGLTRYSEK